jgi:hypothetical protein
MTDPELSPLALPRARRLRVVATTALWGWIAVGLAFLIGVAVQANGRLLAGLGALASILFATSFTVYAAASRREIREMAELSMRHDLRAARSRR